ncbi:MAG: hypothetical protein ACKOJD_01870, partial [Candidatus Limnocylindrus sp.]
PQPANKEQIATRVRELWDQIEAMIKADPLLAGRVPYLWNSDLRPDKSQPSEAGSKRRTEPKK